jgi:catalase
VTTADLFARLHPAQAGRLIPEPPADDSPSQAKQSGTQALASGMPFNTSKQAEFGKRARVPVKGQSIDAGDPIVGASTVSEGNPSEKVGSGDPQTGLNPGNGPLERVRVASTGQRLTTNQGVPIADNQNSLKAGLRGPFLLEDFILREKITHFDHERIPERVGHER